MWYSQIIKPYDFTHLILEFPLCNYKFYHILQTLPSFIIMFFKFIYLYCFTFVIIFGIGYYLFIKKDFLKSDTILVDLAIGWLLAGIIYSIAVVKSPFQVDVAKNLINMNLFWIFTKPTYEIPSLHTAYSFLIALHYKDEDSNIKYLFYILAILIPISTLIVGMHWIVDVITGYIYGYIIYKIPKNIHYKIYQTLEFLAGYIKICNNCMRREKWLLLLLVVIQ